MSITIRIARSYHDAPQPATGFAGALGATVPSGGESEEVEIIAPSKADVRDLAAAAALAFGASHGIARNTEAEYVPGGIADEARLLRDEGLSTTEKDDSL